VTQLCLAGCKRACTYDCDAFDVFYWYHAVRHRGRVLSAATAGCRDNHHFVVLIVCCLILEEFYVENN